MNVEPWGADLEAEVRERFAGDVERRCASLRLTWRTDSIEWMAAMADLDGRWILTPPLRREIDYWVALHEIGHFAAGDLPTSDDNGAVLWENELAVWCWALDHALIRPSGLVQGWIYATFFSYPASLAPAEVRQRARSRIGEGGFAPYEFKSDERADGSAVRA